MKNTSTDAMLQSENAQTTMPEAQDFLDECEQLSEFVQSLPEGMLDAPTGFKGWTGHEIIRHLHLWNIAAHGSLEDTPEFAAFVKAALPNAIKHNLRPFEAQHSGGLTGKELLTDWRQAYRDLAGAFSGVDPASRVKWAGPDMSARSSITARLMETWAHGQAIYDLAGVQRQPHDRIRNIVMLGYNTYSWAFKSRGQDAPEPRPQLILTAPSGEIWTIGADTASERVEGDAEEFCQVVTQTRNIADTDLKAIGRNAALWMQNAQCFAGPVESPPEQGDRKTQPPPRSLIKGPVVANPLEKPGGFR